jgi:hypothetical protein
MDDDLIGDKLGFELDLGDTMGFELDLVRETIAHLKSPQLQQIAQTFLNSNEIVLRLLTLPLTLLTIGEGEKNRVVFLAEAMILSERIRFGDDSDAVMSEVHDQALRRQREVETANPSFNPLASAKAALRRILKLEIMRRPMRALLYSCAVFAWSAFESALKDAWVTAVNLRPFPLGHHSLLALGSDAVAGSGISSKQISVGVLAKHGFDLRDKIGTIIAEKYDFTGTNGMRAAYAAAFDKEEIIDSALSSDELSRLEAIRHVIAHRAGLVDEEFIRRTGGEGQTVGSLLSINGKTLCELIDSAIKATTTVLRHIDARIDGGGAEAVSLASG